MNDSDRNLVLMSNNKRLYNTFWWILTICASLIPVVATLFLIRYYFHAGLNDYMPVWNDEVGYWHEIATFERVGFNGGYYTVEEKIAEISFSHFGTHGPAFAILYGLLGRLFGWYRSSGPIINLILLSLAYAFVIIINKLSLKQILLVGLISLTFWTQILYLPTNMQESLNQAIGIVFAGLILYSVRKTTPFTTSQLVFFGFFIFFSSMIRATWATLLLPLLLITQEKNGRTKPFLLISIGVILTIFLLVFSKAWTSPYPDGFLSQLLEKLSHSWRDGLLYQKNHIIANLIEFTNVGKAVGLERLQRFQIMLVLLVSLFSFGYYFKKDRSINYDQVSILSIVYILAVNLAIQIIFYDVGDWRDLRVLAPYLLLSLLLWIGNRSIKRLDIIILIVIALNILFYPQFIHVYKDKFHHSRFTYSSATFSEFQNETKDKIIYQEGANPWCNSLLSTAIYPMDFIVLPPGIGLSFILDPERLSYPLNSKYLLLDDNTYAVIPDTQKLTKLGSTKWGKLYLNDEVECK
jgi:hypothetical protein